MPKTPQFLTPRGTPKYKRQDSLVQEDFMKSDDFTEAYSHLDENAFQSYQQSFTASDIRGPAISRDSAPPKYGDMHGEIPMDSKPDTNPAFDMTPPKISRYMDPPNMQREVYTFGGTNGKAPLTSQINNDKHQKRNTIWLIILTVLVLLLLIMSSISLYRTSDQQSQLDNMEGGDLVQVQGRDGEQVEAVSNEDGSDSVYTLTTSLKDFGDANLKVLTSLTAGQGYWIDKKNMPDPRSDFQAIYVTKEKQNEISQNVEDSVDLTGQVLIIGGHDDYGKHLKNVLKFDPVLEQYDTYVEDMPQERAKFASVLYKGHILVIGGYENPTKEAANEPEGGMFLYDLNQGGWLSENVSKMNTARSDLCAAVVDGIVYVVGGAGPGRIPLDTIEALDWDTFTWKVVATMPTARADLHCATLNNKLYIAGGNNGGQFEERFVGELLEFDPKTGSITQRASLNYPRADAQLLALPNGHLFIMGGEIHYENSRAQVAINYVEEWIPEEDIWIVRPPVAKGRFRFGVAYIEDSIWVFGGHPTCETYARESCYPEALVSVEAFYDSIHPNVFVLAPPNFEELTNPVLNIDSSVLFKDDPTPEKGFVFGGSLGEGAGYWIPQKITMEMPLSDYGIEGLTDDTYIVFGGMTNVNGSPSLSNKVYVGNTILEQNEPRKDMPDQRARFANTRIDDRVFVLGGVTGIGEEEQVMGSVLKYLVKENVWETMTAQLNTPRTDACAAEMDGTIYIFGGYDTDYNVLDSIEMFTPDKSKEWEVLDSVMPTQRGDVRCAVIGGEIYVIGGFTNENLDQSEDQHTDVVEVFNPANMEWHTVAPLPLASGDSVAVALPGDAGIMVVGGETHVMHSNETLSKGEIAMHNVFQYLPAHDVWVERAPLPEARFRAGGLFIDDSVLIMGGHKTCDTDADAPEQQCYRNTFSSQVAYFDLNTPDIFVFTKNM